jgi:hypothetical protein
MAVGRSVSAYTLDIGVKSAWTNMTRSTMYESAFFIPLEIENLEIFVIS